MILCFLKVIPMRFFSVVIFLHAFKIESSLQKFCPGLFKSRWHGCFSIMHRERSSLQRPVACDQPASGQLQNCVLVYLLPPGPLCVSSHPISVSQLQGNLTPHLDHIKPECAFRDWGFWASFPNPPLSASLAPVGFLLAGSTFASPSSPRYLVALFHSLLCDSPEGEWSGSHSLVGSGPRPVPRPLPSQALLLWGWGARGWIQEERALPALATAHSPYQEDICQPWCRRSLGVYYLSGQPGHVTRPEDTSEIKGTFPEPWHSRVIPQTCQARWAAKTSTGLALCPNSHAFLRSQSNLTSF